MPSLSSRWAAELQAHWWRPRPSLAMRCLQPLAWLLQGLAALHRHWVGTPASPGLPVVVVGNLVVGGAGKTPTVIALVQWLRQQGWQPGVVSRGYGRRSAGFIQSELLPRVRYYAYIDIPGNNGWFNRPSDLWQCYEAIGSEAFQMRQVHARSDIWPVFRQLFAKKEHA